MEEVSTGAFSKIYQFKITIKYFKPQVWRRIQVPENYNFFEFHTAVVCAMGWSDQHLHAFKILNPRTRCIDRIPSLDLGYGEPKLSDQKVFIKDYFLNPGDKADYEYDFGSTWYHKIELEEILPAKKGDKYPRCLAGKNACPIEDGCVPPNYDPKRFVPSEVEFLDPKDSWKLDL